jgi:hypothetical protein
MNANEEIQSFLQQISDLIKTGTVKESELLLQSIAQTVRHQNLVTPGQRSVVERMERGTYKISKQKGRSRFGYTYGGGQ